MSPSFSYRFIAGSVGFKSAGHFTQILSGKVNISIKLIDRFSEFLRLSDTEAEYFRNLVLHNQATNETEREKYGKKLVILRQTRIRMVNSEQLAFYSRWYYSAIRELFTYYSFSGDYADLAQQLRPSITVRQAKEAVDLLVEWGLISKDSNGFLRPVDTQISSPRNTSKTVGQALINETLALAYEALKSPDSSTCDCSTVTLAFSPEQHDEIVREIRHFRRRIMRIAASSGNATKRLHQCNIQLFRISK